MGFHPWVISITVQSLKTIGQSTMDLEYTQVLKMGGSYLGNKMGYVKIFLKSSLLDPETKKEDLKMIS